MMVSNTQRRRLGLASLAVAALLVVPTTGFAQSPAPIVPDTSVSGVVTVAMVQNPQMVALVDVLPDFYARYPNIKLNILILPENDVRAKVTTDVTSGANQFDLVTIGMYETPQWGARGWIDEVGTTLDANPDYDSADFFKSVRDGLSVGDKLYAAPFYGESSALFYRKDLFDAAGLTMPEKPTWDQVAEFAKALNKPDEQQYGICLRGLPGWGEQGAPLGTVINTFGGRWFDANWDAQITSPETSEAIKFYIDLLKTAGEPGAITAGFAGCQTLWVQGRVAMWYDATSAADKIFDQAQNPDFFDKTAIAYAPTKVKDNSGWLWAWAFALEAGSKNKDAAYKFLEWATGKDYPLLVNEKQGSWGLAPSGARKSLYEDAGYAAYGAAFNPVVLDSLNTVDPNHATVYDDTPYTGIQFVQIPEFQKLGDDCTKEFAGAITGNQTADQAIENCQKFAQVVGDSYK